MTAIISPRLTGTSFGKAIANFALGIASQKRKNGGVMGAAHDWIFAGGDLRYGFSLIVFPNGLVVFKLSCVL